MHVITKKGKGYKPAEESSDKFHGVNKFNIKTGHSLSSSNKQTFSEIFGKTLENEALQDEKIVGITAAMASGTGLNSFSKKFPQRFFDVGIAEQHAVTFSAGLASEGSKMDRDTIASPKSGEAALRAAGAVIAAVDTL